MAMPTPIALGSVIPALLFLAGSTGAQPVPSNPPIPTGAPIEQAGLESLIRELGSPRYETRKQATRRLCMAGHRAAPALLRAAEGDEYEAALRARSVLDLLDSLYFGGCTIRLAADKSHLAWNEPFALTVVISNESRYRAFIPLEPASSEVGGDARQVGDLLDLADHLWVVAPDGRPVRLRVDDLRDDARVTEAVDWRAEGGPVVELPPGKERVVRIPNFNRGWARYPLLTAGTHTIQFDYVPQWDDEEFSQAGVGRVASNVLTVEVTRGCPPVVARSRLSGIVTVERQAAYLVARLTNGDDLPITVNTNWGGPQAPFAQLLWTVTSATGQRSINRAGQAPERPPQRALSDFARDRIVELAPGDSLDLDRIPLSLVLESQSPGSGISAGGAEVEVHVTLVNQCDLAWQQQHDPPLVNNRRVPQSLREPLPRRMLTGRIVGQPLRLADERDAP